MTANTAPRAAGVGQGDASRADDGDAGPGAGGAVAAAGGGDGHGVGWRSGGLVHELLTEAAARAPGATALAASGVSHTFGDVDQASDGLAAALQAAGVRRGDRVAIMGDNSAEVVVALFAALKAGGVFVVVNPSTKTDALAHVLVDSGARAVVAQSRLARVVVPALPQAPTVAATVWIGPVPPGVPNASGTAIGGRPLVAVAYEQAVAGGDAVAEAGTIDDDLAALIYTSGSTGRPKGVMLTHRNIVHSSWSIATYLGQRPGDVVACVLPLSFGYGLFQVIVGARLGYTTVLESSFAYPRDVLARLAEHRVTVLPGVPTIFATILQLGPLDDLDLSSLRQITNAAAALPPAHIARLRQLFPGVDVVSMYGQTECTRISYLPPDLIDVKAGSVGKAIPNTEAYVVDEWGKQVGPDVEGELVVRGASVMRGYWGDPERTAERLREGPIPGERVLYTGDRFRADADGLLYFVARSDDVFKCKGEKVSPSEVEQVLYELEAVAEAAVVGVPDEIDGMAVKAVVTGRPGAELTPDAVRHHCRARLAGYMVPKLVEVRDSLPKTASGKIRRAELAE
jgi:long-chain acyl-CoA synthetase